MNIDNVKTKSYEEAKPSIRDRVSYWLWYYSEDIKFFILYVILPLVLVAIGTFVSLYCVRHVAWINNLYKDLYEWMYGWTILR